MHCKCLLSERSLFIGSANLTNAALDNNMELGVLTSDPKAVNKLIKQLHKLVAVGILQAYNP